MPLAFAAPLLGGSSGLLGSLGGLGGIGSALGGLGSLVGGLFGGGSSKSPNYKKQARDSILGAVDAAREVGLHPLAALGAAGGGGGGFSVPSVGDRVGNTLEGLGDTLQRFGDRKAEEPLQKKQLTLLDAEIAEARSRTVLNAANARRALTGPIPKITGISGGLESLDRPPLGRRPINVEPESNKSARQTVSLGRHTAVGPNPDAFEVGLSELIAGAMIYGPQWLGAELKDGWVNQGDALPDSWVAP